MSTPPDSYGPASRSADFGDGRALYQMYLILSPYYENYEPLRHFIQLLENFALDTEKVSLVIPATGRYTITRNRILAVPWDLATLNDLRQASGPILLIIRTTLAHFNPQSDEFMLFKFPAAIDLAEHEQYVALLREMSVAVDAGDDLFAWRRGEKRRQTANTLLRRLYDSIELKPGMLGCSVDLKKLIIGR